MTQQAYKSFCGDMVKNFDKDWAKVGGKLDFAWRFLEHIPERAWKDMVRIAIDKWTGWPFNWAKAVKEIYEEWRRDVGISNQLANYDADDDPRFPVALLWEAFWILKKQGYPQYRTFCDSWRMPKNDRARVENKHRVIEQHLKHRFKLPLESVGQRLNPKTDRPPWLEWREPGEDG